MIEALHFSISEEISSRYPELRVALLHVSIPRGFGVSLPEPEDFAIPTRHGITQDTIAQHPAISSWREAYRKQGLKPSDWRSSIEALVRRLLRSQSIRTGVPFVDLYNLVSVETLTPMGAYDLGALGGTELALRGIEVDDVFESFDGKTLGVADSKTAAVYASGNRILCYGINYRDAALTAMRSETTEAIVMFDCVSAALYGSQSQAVDRLCALASQAGVRCGEAVYAGPGAAGGTANVSIYPPAPL